MDLQSVLTGGNAHIIDVREPFEYDIVHLDKAINVPMSQLHLSIGMIKQLSGPKVLYCRSGNRSGQATQYLASLGIKDVYNGGSLAMMRGLQLA